MYVGRRIRDEGGVCVCLGGKKRKQKQNKSKGSVGY